MNLIHFIYTLGAKNEYIARYTHVNTWQKILSRRELIPPEWNLTYPDNSCVFIMGSTTSSDTFDMELIRDDGGKPTSISSLREYTFHRDSASGSWYSTGK